ncbi:MAG: hypothetical protein LQ344_006340 [Seirophora lacunosa]|nr:MAG: hypothetical protein LQ344_006340 [Seirophora lacunosa]
MLTYSRSSVAFALAIALNSFLSTASPTSSSISARGVSGINKDGSSKCWEYTPVMEQIKERVSKIQVGTTFVRGEKIACAGYDVYGPGVPDHNQPYNDAPAHGICASLCENTPAATVGNSTNNNANSFADVIGDLVWFGAEVCGTAPLDRTTKNDKGEPINQLSTGCISVNYVWDVCWSDLHQPCTKVCQDGRDPKCLTQVDSP